MSRDIYRKHYQILNDLVDVIDANKEVGNVHHRFLVPISDELATLAKEIPDLSQGSPIESAFSHSSGRDRYYQIGVIRMIIGSIRSKLKVLLEDSENLPSQIIKAPDFTFIKDSKLKLILERDFIELQKCCISNCWKSVLILSGGILETMLLDVTKANATASLASVKKPKNNNDINSWKLSDLIKVCVEEKFVSPGIDKLSHSLREYRNLVHPDCEIREQLAFGGEEARISVEIVSILIRDLSP